MAALSSCVLSSRLACDIKIRLKSMRLDDDVQCSPKAAGCIPPQMSPALTALPVRRGRRFLSHGKYRLHCHSRELFQTVAQPNRRILHFASHFSRRHGNIRHATHPDTAMKRFADLSEQEVLALAITNEEEDSRIYQGFADGLRAQYPSSAKMFDAMAQ